MKISAYYKSRGYSVKITKGTIYIRADNYFSSSIFHNEKSSLKVNALLDLFDIQALAGGESLSLGSDRICFIFGYHGVQNIISWHKPALELLIPRSDSQAVWQSRELGGTGLRGTLFWYIIPSPTVEPDPDNAGGGKMQPSSHPSSGGFFSIPQRPSFEKYAWIIHLKPARAPAAFSCETTWNSMSIRL